VARELESARRKLNRAEKHLHELVDAYRAYAKDNPYLAIAELNDEAQMTGKAGFLIPDAPDDLSDLIGDCVTNLRAALDHLVYQLVKRDTGAFDPTGTGFPIYTSVADYRKWLSGSGTKRKKRPKEWRLRPYRRAAIRKLQPYQRRDNPDAHPLAVLNRLANRDKHRIFHSVFPNLPPGTLVVEHPGFGSLTVEFTEVLRPVVKGDAKVRFEETDWIRFKPQVDVNGNFLPYIAFEDGLPILETLYALGSFVGWVLYEFNEMLDFEEMLA
jgi:hypothetical protein